MSDVYQMMGPTGLDHYEVNWEALSIIPAPGRPAKSLLIPGFIDVHVHGGYGIDFMTASKAEMEVLCRKLEASGYEGFLPTTVTATPDAILRAVNNLPDHPMILGFHMEGPFISPKYPGAQPPSAIALPPEGPSEWDEILDHPQLRLVTLAPEIPRALELSLRLMKRGVTVSMGHSNATYDEARRGFEFGATHTTHTYNAMSPLHHREAGMVGYALSNDAVTCELIYDRIHVSQPAAALLLRSKPKEKVIAVSDGTMACGLTAGQPLEMWGLKCIVGKGQVRLEDGTIAGSAITLYEAFKNLYEDFGPETAIRLCCLNPRLALGIHREPTVWIELDSKLKIVGRHAVAKPICS